MHKRFLSVLIVLCLNPPLWASWGGVTAQFEAYTPSWVLPGYTKHISGMEFEYLVIDLAKKVDIFADVWKEDPEAEFFGGTSRDFVYWVLGKLQSAASRAEMLQRMQTLRTLPTIRAREFLFKDSDVDVVGREIDGIYAATYGIRKIDWLSKQPFLYGTREFSDEINQGYIPAEKIRLAYTGFKHGLHVGNGVTDIYRGRLQIHLPTQQQFRNTKRAQENLNHLVLLSVRFLRLIAMDYYYRYGRGVPDEAVLMQHFNQDDLARMKQIILRASDGHELLPHLADHRFVRWLNGLIEKMYRSYTNPNASHMLLDKMGVLTLIRAYKALKSPNSYLFAKVWDERTVRNNFMRFRINEQEFYKPVQQALPGRTFYHGVRSDDAFSNILEQFILPSADGTAGDGVYGVAKHNIEFAHNWGGTADRTVEIRLSPFTNVVDVTTGEGKRVLNEIGTLYPQLTYGRRLSLMAQLFAIDVIRYDYTTEAFLLKNSAVVEDLKGYRVNVQLGMEWVQSARAMQTLDDLSRVIQSFSLNRYRSDEVDMFAGVLGEGPLQNKIAAFEAELFSDITDRTPEEFASALLEKQLAHYFYKISENSLLKTLFAIKQLRLLGRPEVIGYIEPDKTQTPTLEFATQLREAGFSVQEIIDSLALLKVDAKEVSQLLAWIVNSTTDRHEFLDVLDGIFKQGRPDNLEIPTVLNHFFSLQPSATIPDVKKLEAIMISDSAARLELWKRSLPLVGSAEDFIHLVQIDGPISPMEANQKNAFAKEHLDLFLSFSPTIGEIKAFELAAINQLSDSLQLIDSALAQFASQQPPDDFISLTASAKRQKDTPFQLALDDLVVCWLPRCVHSEWTITSYATLLDQAIVTKEGLSLVWRTALDHLSQKEDLKVADFLKLLEPLKRVPLHSYGEALNSFLQNPELKLWALSWTKEELKTLYGLPQLHHQSIKTAGVALVNQLGVKAGLSLQLEALVDVSLAARMGLQTLVTENFAEYYKEYGNVDFWIKLASQIDLEPGQLLVLTRDAFDATEFKPSRVIGLLQILASTQIELRKVFSPAFANLSPEHIEKAMQLRLPVRTLALILLFSRYSYADLDEWRTHAGRWMDRNQRLKGELRLIAKNKALRPLTVLLNTSTTPALVAACRAFFIQEKPQ